MGGDWPGAYARVARNRIIERWLGRPGDVRQHRQQLLEKMFEARKRGDVQESILYWGQGAGLIDEITPAAKVVTDLVEEAEAILTERLPALVGRKAATR